MPVINTKIISDAIYKLCLDANVQLSGKVYFKILNAYHKEEKEHKDFFKSILQNAHLAYINKRPLCQDTGQVLVFIQIGQEVSIEGADLNYVINSAVEKCYKEQFFRTSVVKNAIFNRTNTCTNTPAIIYYDIVPGNEIKIDVLIKGAGSENKSDAAMLLPGAAEEEIIDYIVKTVISSGFNSCPPLFIGVGIGGTFDKASVLAKKALLADDLMPEETDFAKRIKTAVNSSLPTNYPKNYVLDVKVLTAPTHIASLPVSVSINCHSSRKASCIIRGSEIEFLNNIPEFANLEENSDSHTKEVNAQDINSFHSIKSGDAILLSGTIFVARDAAHKRLFEAIANGEQLPFDIKNNIIFYAGPCPPNESEVIGPIGPTTSSRMDKYASKLYDMGLLATIGKGSRNNEVMQALERNKAYYFKAGGGIASLLSSKIKEAQVIAYEDLGPEAIYKIKVEKLPLSVA